MGSSPFVISFSSRNERGINAFNRILAINRFLLEQIFHSFDYAFIEILFVLLFFLFLFFIFNSAIRFVFLFRHSHALAQPATLYHTKRINDSSVLKWYEKWCDHAMFCYNLSIRSLFFIVFNFNEKKNLWNEMLFFRFDTHVKQINVNTNLNWCEKLKVSLEY